MRANRFFHPTCFLVLSLLLVACGDENTRSPVQAPGAEKSVKTNVLEAGADVLQGKEPLRNMNIYLDGFHFYDGTMRGQMEAHHFCTKLNEDVIQAVIFDGNAANAKLMGVEYIVSRRLFEQLPAEEKKLWHSHRYEVKSGTLVAPGLPDVAEHELMEQLVDTYGKTIHTWHTDRDKELPYGGPQLMMGFTQDGQIDTAMVGQRDRRMQISTAEKRRQRADIPAQNVLPGADAWEKGEVRQFEVTTRASATHQH